MCYHRIRLQRLGYSKTSLFSSTIRSLCSFWLSPHGEKMVAAGKLFPRSLLHPASFLAPLIGLHVIVCPYQNQSWAKEVKLLWLAWSIRPVKQDSLPGPASLKPAVTWTFRIPLARKKESTMDTKLFSHVLERNGLYVRYTLLGLSFQAGAMETAPLRKGRVGGNKQHILCKSAFLSVLKQNASIYTGAVWDGEVTDIYFLPYTFLYFLTFMWYFIIGRMLF